MQAVRRLVRSTPWITGRALHCGRRVAVRVEPRPPGQGIVLVRHDLPGAPHLPARPEFVAAGPRCTTLRARCGAEVATVEHLMAALCGTGIRDARVLVRGPELPALDGSAAPLARALVAASEPIPANALDAPGRWAAAVVTGPVVVQRGRSRCALLPAATFEIRCTVVFGHRAVGRQHLVWRPSTVEAFLNRLAPARTFGFLHERNALAARGRARGASLGNTLVFGPAGPLNPAGTRFVDEPVRHKVLDALGDLAILGAPLAGRVVLHRCSHALLLATVRHALASGRLRLTTPGG